MKHLPYLSHFEHFFHHPRRGDLAPIFPNAKEVTESFGAFHAVISHHLADRGDGDVTVLVVGDGVRPQTGAIFESSTNWDVVSIDPKMKGEYPAFPKLRVVAAPIEETGPWVMDGGHVVVVHVHSHATLDATLSRISRARMVSVVAIPCCVPQFISRPDGPIEPDYVYRDEGIVSPENEVKVWRRVK